MRPGALAWALLALLGWAFARRTFDVVEVRGRSMVPTLLPGDRLLVARLPARAGDVVLAADPRVRERELIKMAALSAALADGLHRRGVADPTARLAAEAGIAVFRVAFERWLAEPEGRGLARVMRRADAV